MEIDGIIEPDVRWALNFTWQQRGRHGNMNVAVELHGSNWTAHVQRPAPTPFGCLWRGTEQRSIGAALASAMDEMEDADDPAKAGAARLALCIVDVLNQRDAEALAAG